METHTEALPRALNLATPGELSAMALHSTPSSFSLWDEYSVESRRAAAHPRLPEDTIQQLVDLLCDSPYLEANEGILNNPNLTVTHVTQILDSRPLSPIADRLIAHPAYPLPMLTSMATSGARRQRAYAATNPQLPYETAYAMAESESLSVKKGLTRNPGLHPDITAILAYDSNPAVRLSLLQHGHVTDNLLEDAFNRGTIKGLCAVGRHSDKEDMLAAVAAHEDMKVRSSLLHNRHARDEVKTLVALSLGTVNPR